MSSVKLGSSGDLVKLLQQNLIREKFYSGEITGKFDKSTENAVLAFQKTHGLSQDGIAGNDTFDKFDRIVVQDNGTKFTIDVVSSMFPNTPVKNIISNLPFVLSGLDDFKLTEDKLILTALSTIRAETESFQPVIEGISKYNTTPGGHAFDKYDFRKDLGNSAKGDGAKYPGSGYVQLTGKANFIKYGKLIGVDLVNNPKLACESVNAGKILAAFISEHSDKMLTALNNNDLAKVRKLVNGGSLGLDKFTDAFNRGLHAIS